MQNRCSTTELHPLNRTCMGLTGIEPATPPLSRVCSTNELQTLLVCFNDPIEDRLDDYPSLIIGGGPAAGSPTATLLRLHPSHKLKINEVLPEG